MAILPLVLLAFTAIFTTANGLDTYGIWLPGATGPVGATRTTTATATATTTTATTTTPSSGSGGQTTPTFPDSMFLLAVNGIRSEHSASSLTTDTALKAKARTCADFYANNKELSGNTATITEYCEELGDNELDVFYTGANSTAAAITMVTDWYEERCGQGTAYNFTSPSSVTDYKRFTQLVWKATTKVGCSYSTVTNQNDSQKDKYVTVCVFSPAGNQAPDGRVTSYKSNVVDATPSSLLTCTSA